MDDCPQCRGVWLDRGELDKIIERSQRQEAANAPQQAGRSSPQPESDGQNDGHHNGVKHHGRHGPMQGRQSPWKEIFD
jgi:Zn-finger nucleic acid-binding protein